MQPPPSLELNIEPYEAVGSIRFGMTASQVRGELAEHRVEREPNTPCDRFEDVGIRVYYAADGTTEAVELRPPARPLLDGRALLGTPYRPLEAWLSTLDGAVKLEHSGLTSMAFGIRLYAASAKRLPDSPVEVVTVFARAYYQKYIASILPPAGPTHGA